MTDITQSAREKIEDNFKRRLSRSAKLLKKSGNMETHGKALQYIADLVGFKSHSHMMHAMKASDEAFASISAAVTKIFREIEEAKKTGEITIPNPHTQPRIMAAERCGRIIRDLVAQVNETKKAPWQDLEMELGSLFFGLNAAKDKVILYLSDHDERVLPHGQWNVETRITIGKLLLKLMHEEKAKNELDAQRSN